MHSADSIVAGGGPRIKSATQSAVPLLTLVVPAIMGLRFAQYLIETFFPDLTLIDLRAFYGMGLSSGLASGIWLGRSRRDEGRS